MPRLLTLNVRCNPKMRQSSVLHDVAWGSRKGDGILWQEIEIARYKQAVTSLLPAPKWDTNGLALECPISLSTKMWEVLDWGLVRTHSGRKRTSPHRYVVWVVARRKNLGVAAGKRRVVAFINTHFVNGAFNRKHLLTRAWRRQRWDIHYSILKEMVHRFVAAGITVLGGGDWNRSAVPKFVPYQRWMSKGGIDHLFTVEAPRGVRVRIVDTDTSARGELKTDHPGKIVKYRLATPATYVEPTLSDIPRFNDLRPNVKITQFTPIPSSIAA